MALGHFGPRSLTNLDVIVEEVGPRTRPSIARMLYTIFIGRLVTLESTSVCRARVTAT
jgi:hypothetical protein